MSYLFLVAGTSLFFVLFIEEIEFKHESFIPRWESLYEGVDFMRQKRIVYPAVFFFRRLLLVCAFHMDIISVRLYIVSFIGQTAYIMYLSKAKPKTGQELRIEMINEVVFMVCMDTSPIYTPLMTNKVVEY